MARNNPRPLPPPWDRIFPLATRVFVWALLASILYLLRSFFLLIFLTFVFAYVQAHGVQRLAPIIKIRWIRVVLVALVFLGLIVGAGIWMVPNITKEAKSFVDNQDTHYRAIDTAIADLRTKSPMLRDYLPEVDTPPSGKTAKRLLVMIVAGFSGSEATDTPAGASEALARPREHEAQSRPGGQEAQSKHSAATAEPQSRPSDTDPAGARPGIDEADRRRGEDRLKRAWEAIKKIGPFLIGIVSALLLSLLFSFLIVLDLPKLERLVRKLEETKLQFIYLEVAENIRDFGVLLGRSLEAQLFIAVLNTVLTAIGLWIMGLPSIAFLSAIVFFFSFVPIFGVFVSSIPICLIALNEAGAQWMLLAIMLITAIHLIETYILNPMIYGHHLRVNPVIVLSVLTVAGTLFHIWGLVLGLPVLTYIFGTAIHYKPGQGPTSADAGLLPFRKDPKVMS